MMSSIEYYNQNADAFYGFLLRAKIEDALHILQRVAKKEIKMGRVGDYKAHLLQQLQDRKEAAAYLNAALQDEDPHVFLLALRDIAEAQGGMSWLAEEADLNRESLYCTLSLRWKS